VLNIVITAKLSLLQDMQQGRTTTMVEAAATSCVCLKFRNGEGTSMNLHVTLDRFTALSTSCGVVEVFATTYSPKTTPVAH